MFGKNPLRPPEKGDGSTLLVQSIFHTIQGEGPRAGQPATFIRLGGCNLACKFCDTEFESFKPMPLSQIISKATGKLIIITGGEPFRQPIEKLCEELIALGKIVQIETNGTLFRDLPKEVEIVCSPKTSEIRADLDARVTAYKFLISASLEGYTDIKFKTNKPIYVQPMDEYDEDKMYKNIEHTKNLAMENGYNISLQLHKILGIE